MVAFFHQPLLLTSVHVYWHHFTKTEMPLGVYVAFAKSMAPQDPYPSPPPSPNKAKVDPILRNALRYTISAKEYKTLHQYLISRSPPAVRRRAPPPPKYASLVQTNDDYNGAAIRASLRAFVITQTSLKLWESIKTNLLSRGRPSK